MKNLSETLQEKYLNETKNEKAKLSRFLKRRRLELGKTLEEVSEGVCSTSYLSKIENCVVDVDESYFKMLFEKVGLEYNVVLEERKIPIYNELIKAYLTNNVKYIETKTNNVVETNNYSDAEIEIILILYNLINGTLNEAKKSISRLDQIKNTLSLEELTMLGFLKVLQMVKCHELSLVENDIDQLLKTINENEIIYYAVKDLAVEYYFLTNQKMKFLESFEKLKTLKVSKLFVERETKHWLQKLVLEIMENENAEENILKEFALIKEIDSFGDINLYNFYYAVYLVVLKKYEQAYLLLKTLRKDQHVLALKAYVCDQLNVIAYTVEYLNEIEDIDNNTKTPYGDYIEYMRLKFEQYSYGHLLNFLKNRVLENQQRYANYFLEKIEKLEYYNIAFELGKYKEIAKKILNRN